MSYRLSSGMFNYFSFFQMRYPLSGQKSHQSTPIAFLKTDWNLHLHAYAPKILTYVCTCVVMYTLSILNRILIKVEKILKGSLDLIPSPSPSLNIQIMGGKVCWSCKGKTLLGVANKLLKTKSLLTTPSNAHTHFTPQANFPANNLNFH